MKKIQVIVQVSIEVAQALHQKAPPTTELQELSETLASYGVILEAMHPDTEDPLLAPWFMIEVTDFATAEQLVIKLQHYRAIKAAYVKPSDELPLD